jgi:hypothetical protein
LMIYFFKLFTAVSLLWSASFKSLSLKQKDLKSWIVF